MFTFFAKDRQCLLAGRQASVHLLTRRTRPVKSAGGEIVPQRNQARARCAWKLSMFLCQEALSGPAQCPSIPQARRMAAFNGYI